jgi:hypothetical protein
VNIDLVMQIYREAVDPTATAGEGLDWWSEVQAEVVGVIAAPTQAAAATIIAWWKSQHEWAQCGDSPERVAGRIRKVAKVFSK